MLKAIRLEENCNLLLPRFAQGWWLFLFFMLLSALPTVHKLTGERLYQQLAPPIYSSKVLPLTGRVRFLFDYLLPQ
jgi:hypothetical protein